MKSKIQMIQESINIKHQLTESLNNLMDEYNINDNIFIYTPNKHNCSISEVVSGYFESLGEYNTLEEAMSEIDPFTHCIRIINNEKFQIGYMRNNISECNKEHKIKDLYSGKDAN